SGVTAVKADLVSCPVNVSTHSGSDTRVKIRRVGLGIGRSNEPAVSLENGVLTVRQPRVLLNFSTVGYIVDITVPADACLDYDLMSISGSVRLDAPGNTAKLRTTSGSIRMSGSAVNVEAESVSGSVKLYGDERTQTVRAVTTSGSIKTAAGKNAQSIYATSTSGSVKISIPPDLGYTMDYKTASGSVKDVYRGVAYEKQGTAEAWGANVVAITARSTSGSIKLTDWD
ncbi:MAG: DUF4097 family beta strand repeat-containing protein, partial [Clostridia bacterium]|nr:DUF4097 family beta strand repeat-containing protein [Clostridia bacterium]